jgi:hypothetical protein
MEYADVGSPTMGAPMRRVKGILVAVTALVAGVVYVWFAAVRAVPGVRRRKEAARRE